MVSVPHMIDQIGGVRKTAAAMGVPPTTVQHWKNRGEAPSWRLGDLTAAYNRAAGQKSVAA